MPDRPQWPETLPARLLREGFEERPPALVKRTQMDAGPAKQRRRFTAAPRPITGTIALTAAQRAILDAFFMDELQGGAIAFDWVHPVTRATATFRFVHPDPLIYHPRSAGRFSAALKLEIMP